ncbi:MAG: hypothetical protein ABL308_00375 [Oceanicaulis sp.]
MVRVFAFMLGAVLAIALVRTAFVVIPASGVLEGENYADNAACTAVEIAPGTEDVTFDPVTGLAFVSAAERRTGVADPLNGIYAFDPDDPDSVRAVSTDAPADFRPHGISLYRDGEVARLFVISHPASGHQVLIYDIGADGTLSHVRTVTDPAIRSPNDIAATGPESFYVTNDAYFSGGPMAMAEPFLGLPGGSIAFFDGREGRIVAKSIAYANGIQLSPDGEEVYASAFIGRTVHVFDRNPVTGDLVRSAKHRVPLGLDNIELGEDGSLYIAGNTEVFSFLAHQSDPEARAPSKAVRVDPESGAWDTVFHDDGSGIDSASVAAPAGDRLILGAVFDSHVLVCPR